MPIFDTHAHYDADRFDSDRDALLSAMPGVGVGLVLDPGCDLPSSRAAAELAELSGRFNYEFVCDLGKRIPRSYYLNGEYIGTHDCFRENWNLKNL